MHRSISWIDPGELAILARRASSERVEPRPPAPAPAAAPVASAPPPPTPAAEPPPFEVRGATLEERVSHFLDWLCEAAQTDRVFVTDSNGLAVAVRAVAPDHVATSAVLMRTLQEVRATIASERRMAITTGVGEVLHIVAMDTEWGAFGAGLVADDMVPDDVLARAQTALAHTLGEVDE